jgi:hypothetical protein
MTTKKNVARRPKRRPYRVPTLKVYGDLRKLTMGKGGAMNDGAQPKTRMGGGA